MNSGNMGWNFGKSFGNTAMGLGGIGAGLMGLFGSENPADNAMPFLQQIPEAMRPYFQPYMQAGERALPKLESEYGNLMNDPSSIMNKIGGGFQKSPGFDFALKQALQGASHAAAAGGMAGSPQHMQQEMQLGTQLGNQDYYNYMNHSLGLYGQGLGGLGNLANMGFGASKSMSDQIAQALAAQAALSYAGQAGQNQSQGSGIGNLIGGLGMLFL